ncbi:MAG TPA: TRAP transporter substrate-binding protein [Devosiaceae bacterium]
MKLITSLIGATAVSILMAGSALAQEVTLRFHQFLPAQATIPANAIAPWAKKVEEESNGRIKVELYPAMQLGGAPPQLFDQAKDGVVDIVWTVLGYTPGRFPKAEVFELPFIAVDAQSTSRAYQRYIEKYDMDEFKDVHIIAVHTHGPGLFHTKNPVTKLEDLKGMKIRGGSRLVNELLTALGATPVGMPVPAVPEALSKGVIDGTTIPWEVTTALKTSELVHNHTGFTGAHGLYTQTFVVAMNKAVYDGLPDDLKKVIDDNSGIAVAEAFGKAMDDGDKVGLKVAEDLGNNIITLDAAETKRWQDAAQPIIDKWIADTPNGQELYDAAKALIAEESGM